MKLRHLIVAGWRAALAARALSLIALLGLVIGLTAAILMLIVVRGAFQQNGFVPHHDRTYLAVSMLAGPDGAPMPNEATSGLAAPLVAGNVTAIEAWSRLAEEEVSIRRGATVGKETIYWADPSMADVLPRPVVFGDLAAALARPDGMAMTAAAARRWFGRDNALGLTLNVAGKAMTVEAILADLPPDATDLTHDIFASARNAASVQRRTRATPGGFAIDSRTYVRLRSDANANAVEKQMRPFVDTLLPSMMKGAYHMRLARLDRLSLDPDLHPGARDRLLTGTLIAALVLFIALANTVNLALARAGRRRKEIGVRMAAGAAQGQIAAQFLGEAVAATFVAAVLAIAASEWLLGPLNAFLDTTTTINYARSPALIVGILIAAIVIGLAAGLYPALVVSRLSPSTLLRPGARTDDGGTRLRSALATLQFAVLIGLLIATGIVYQQRHFAMVEGTRADISHVLTVEASCPAGFVAEVARLPGVEGASCSGAELVSGDTFAFVDLGGRRVPTNLVAVLPSLFRLYGIVPIAGSLAGLPALGEERVRRIVVNKSAVELFGFGTPAVAVGKVVPVPSFDAAPSQRAIIVAVVPDFQFTSVEKAAKPTIYVDAPHPPERSGLVSIRLSGRHIPEALQAIDRTWQATGHGEAIERRFLQDRIEELYRDLGRSTQLFGGFALLAVLLGAAGMVGIAIATTDRRTKEIGIRKAMGAGDGQIAALLLRQLTRPALVANFIAWPLTWLVMRRWLDGYAYHIVMPLWLFPAAGAVALLVAVASIGSQALAAARRPPIVSLRSE